MNKDDYNNNTEYFNKEYGSNSSSNWRLKLPLIFVLIIVVITIIIVEDDLSGRNIIKPLFTYLQSRIDSLIKGDENAKDLKNVIYSVNSDSSADKSEEKDKTESKITFSEVEKKYKEKYAHLYELQENDLLEILSDDENQNLVLTKIALDKDYSKLLNEIIKKNNSLVNSDKIGDIPLVYAAEKKSTKCVEVLVNRGANLKFELEDGRNLLHIAAQNNNISLAKQALMAEISVEKKTKEGKSPLYYAVKNNDLEMASFLVNCGADYKDKVLWSITRDKNLQSFLKNGKKPAKYLDVDTELTPEEKEWREAYEYIRDGKLTDLYNLAKNGKDLFKMTYHGEPAPCIAAKYGQYEILKYLIHEFDCKNLVDYEMGRNALHYAVQQSNEKILDLLIQNGFDVNSTDLYNNTPLHYAISNPFPHSVQFLIHHGADPDKYNLKRQTPAHLAAKKGNAMAVILFVKEGANVNFQDFEGNTLLHYVNKYLQDQKVFEALYKIENKLNFNIKNNEGKTPRNISYFDYFEYYEERYR